MNDPASKRDIVSLGVVKDVRFNSGVATVRLAPLGDDKYLNEALADAIRRELKAVDSVERVIVSGVISDPDGVSADEAAPLVSLPIIESESEMNASMLRAGMAPDSGFFEGGPAPLPSPELDIPADQYEAWPPVHQWEIDPTDPALVSAEARASFDGWEYEVWWQLHPADLVYASIQALQEDTITEGPERRHPVGRNVVANLVYDQHRKAVIAIYGTARDFRPFVEAFRIGFGLEKNVKESNE